MYRFSFISVYIIASDSDGKLLEYMSFIVPNKASESSLRNVSSLFIYNMNLNFFVKIHIPISAYLKKSFDNAFSKAVQMKKYYYCLNCNGMGHYDRFCKEPVTSHGIIMLNRGRVLLVQRKISIGFFSFMRGKYTSETLMKVFFEDMTPFERKLLETKTFDEIWEYLWNGANSIGFLKSYNEAKSKFAKCDIEKFLREIPVKFNETEWMFPKGKRNNIHESSISCAIREFSEETGISPNLVFCQFEENSNRPKRIIEIHTGSDNHKYRTIYYLAISDSDSTYELSEPKCNEIRKRKWFTFTEAKKIFRESQTEKKKILDDLSIT